MLSPGMQRVYGQNTELVKGLIGLGYSSYLRAQRERMVTIIRNWRDAYFAVLMTEKLFRGTWA
jgi:hypothetical protein